MLLLQVCLCAYTDHGHCGILYDDGSINNMDSIRRIGEIAYSYGTAGKLEKKNLFWQSGAKLIENK